MGNGIAYAVKHMAVLKVVVSRAFYGNLHHVLLKEILLRNRFQNEKVGNLKDWRHTILLVVIGNGHFDTL